jgi:carbon-monoxide dehydrogenase medium subunit
MKPPAFSYVRAESLDHALAIKAQHGEEGKFLAGGQSLIPALNFRLAAPAVLIDLNRVPELAGICVGKDGELHIGAMTRHHQLIDSAEVAAHQSLLAEAAPNVAHPQVRNRGTFGGNLAHSDPASEYPAVARALGARFVLRSARVSRTVAADDFFDSLYTTALQPDEMLVAVQLPAQAARTGTAFVEVSRRKGDYAMAGVACTLTLDATGQVVKAALAYCNAGPTPMLAPLAAQGLVGQSVTGVQWADACKAAAEQAKGEIEPMGSVQASAGYQRHLAAALTRRALATAARRALAQSATA